MKWFDFWLTSSTSSVSWRELTIFSAYRLFLASTLFIVFYFKLPPSFLGEANPVLYLNISLFYVFMAAAWQFLSLKQWGDYASLTRMQLVIDIVIIIVLIHISGGLQTGLGTLLVVVVIAGGALIPGRISAFIAAIAALSVLLEASYSQITGGSVTKYSHAGMLGATFFVTAWLAQVLSIKMKVSQILLEQHQRNAAKSVALNKHIISSMQTGVLILDEEGVVTLSNQSARSMLGLNASSTGMALVDVIPVLERQLSAWKNQNEAAFKTVQVRPGLPEVQARATLLNNGETLIYLDNASALAQQAQQLKLASLGRLTASIAHEVRNPLGAISHASELLAEANDNNEVSTKLTDIIQRHSARVNGIIETILEMSRRKTVEPTAVSLAPWLAKFKTEFCELKQIEPDDFKLISSFSKTTVNIDVGQLHQIMWNLLENGLHHSQPSSVDSRVQVHLYNKNNEVMIEVNDNGQGVSEKMQQYLFEPFHSDRTGGIGLGLYLARELCQANGARLNYLAAKPRWCFRISFPFQSQEILQ